MQEQQGEGRITFRAGMQRAMDAHKARLVVGALARYRHNPECPFAAIHSADADGLLVRIYGIDLSDSRVQGHPYGIRAVNMRAEGFASYNELIPLEEDEEEGGATA